MDFTGEIERIMAPYYRDLPPEAVEAVAIQIKATFDETIAVAIKRHTESCPVHWILPHLIEPEVGSKPWQELHAN